MSERVADALAGGLAMLILGILLGLALNGTTLVVR